MEKYQENLQTGLDKKSISVYYKKAVSSGCKAEKDIVLYDVKALYEIFNQGIVPGAPGRVGINEVYALMRDKDFPSFKQGRSWLVERHAFLTWIEKRSWAKKK